MAKGATEIYLINVGYGGENQGQVKGITSILSRMLTTFLAQSLFQDLEMASANPDVRLHHIHITEMGDTPFTDFSQVDAMLQAGRNTAERYLRNPQPRQPATGPLEGSLLTPKNVSPAQPQVRGAQPFTPSYRRSP